MIIEYHPDTLVVHHVMHTYDEKLLAHWRDKKENALFSMEEMNIHEVEIYRDDGGKIQLRRRAPMALEHPSDAKAGVEFKIEGVPEGVAITVNDSHIGIMDSSQVLEFTPQAGGVYRFRFEGSGWITTGVTIEAHP